MGKLKDMLQIKCHLLRVVQQRSRPRTLTGPLPWLQISRKLKTEQRTCNI